MQLTGPVSPTVFIVDDDEIVLRSIARLVRSAGYPVEAFSSPRGLLARAQPDWTGCIVFDLLMPDLDGLEAQEMFARQGLRLPVIFISGHGDIPASVRAMKAGAIDFLVKPADGEALLAAIERAIARDATSHRQREERAALHMRYESLTPREREVCVLVAGC